MKIFSNINKLLQQFTITSLVIISACNSGQSPESLLADARGYYEAGELNAATIELKNLLKESPDNAEARLLLGQIAYDRGELRDAEFQLAKAAKLGGDHAKVAPLQAKVLLALNSYDALHEISLDDLDLQGQASVLVSQGLAETWQGKEAQGQTLINEAFALAPELPYVAIAKSRLMMSQPEPDYKAARSLIDAVLAADPKDSYAWSTLAKLEEQTGQLEAAEQAYTQAIDSSANNAFDMLRRALIRIQLEEFDQAQKDIDVLTKRIPQSPAVYYAQGLIHMHEQNFADALTAFDIAAWDEDRFPRALLFSGIINLQEGNYARAEEMANRFLVINQEDVAGKKLLAAIKLKQGLYSEAEQTIRPIVDRDTVDLQALKLLANSLAAQGKSAEYMEVISRIAAIQPDSASAQTRLGLGLITRGARDEGLKHLETALELDPKFQQADIIAILTYLREEDFSEAINAAKDYKHRNPGTAFPYILAGRVYLEAGEAEKAAEEFQTARKIEPGNPGACLSLAAMALENQDTVKARAYFAEILAHHENHLPTLLQLSALEGLEGDEDLMLKYLQQAMQAHPESVEPRLVMARYYLAHGKAFDAVNLLNELGEPQKQRADVLRVTALTEIVRDNYPEARKTLEKLVKLEPDSAEVHHQLAEVYAGLDLNDAVQEELSKAVELAPVDYYIRLANARWSLQTGDTAGFKDHLQALKAMQPQHPAVLELEYVAAKKGGDRERELALARSLLEVAPGTKNMLRLAQKKWNSGDREGSLELQEQWVGEHPEDMASVLALAASYSLEDRVDDAVKAYKKMLENDADSLIALNNLAWLLREKRPSAALEYARKAEALRPDSDAVIDTLAITLLANGEVKEARKAMERVLRKAPKNATYRYHAILVDVAEGKRKKAIGELEVLLAETENFPEKTDAVALLSQLRE